MLVIYSRTNNVWTIEWWRWRCRKYLKRYGGPDAVLRSIIDGLNTLQVPYMLNPAIAPADSFVLVVSGVRILQEMVQKKENGQIACLVAGPNIVVSPEDSQGILMSASIDRIIVPSSWVRAYYCLYGTEDFKERIRVWAAGIRLATQNHAQREIILVYKKTCPDSLYQHVIDTLKKKNIPFVVVEYGKYSQENYISLLQKTKLLIYLQESESQGIAMFEAWAADVPTLNWEPGIYISPRDSSKKVYGKIAAPYMQEKLGVTFRGKSDFDVKLDQFILGRREYRVRNYVRTTFSDSVRALALLKFIYEN